MKNYTLNQNKQSYGNGKSGIVCERRQKSYVKPFIYYCLQILLLIPVLGIFAMNLNPLHWSNFHYVLSLVWILYATKKLFTVLARQSNMS
jgi:hypothetical protein